MLKIRFLIIIVLSFVLYSCSSKNTIELAKIDKCNFPQTKEKAPLWVCGADVEGIVIKGVGVAAKSKAGLSFTKQKAVANARVAIAQELQSEVKSKVSKKISSNNQGSEELVEEVSEFVSSQITNANLTGAKVYREVYSQDGTLYVLVGLNEVAFRKTLDELEEKAKQSKLLSQEAKDTLKNN